MRSRRSIRLVEAPAGRGTLWQAGHQVAEVEYHLEVRQEFNTYRSLNAQTTTPGMLDISGSIKLVSGRDPQPRQAYRLALADGRSGTVYVLQPRGPGVWAVTVSGPLAE